ncbi:CHAP domain-containing protein [Parapedobacter soli]|uniref:CHAP domain-containing protein n=1 Tax=Parapedobacter soli TaxID=416955 RepID=UPI0021CA3CBB|nr:CHAP domain-containing protein [Parapedobacter soli]
MAKDHLLPRYLLRAAVCLCVLFGGSLLGLPFAGSGLPFALSQDRSAHSKRLKETYTAEIGILEATGNNDGRRVGEYLRYCGLDEGYAWCAAFVSWCHGQAGYAAPRNAWSPALFPASRTIWHAGDPWPVNGGQSVPRVGDVFGIYYTNLRRIAHVGFVDGWDGKYCITVEGNTGPPTGGAIAKDHPANPIRAGPDREGVYRKRRPIRTIKAVARWAE